MKPKKVEIDHDYDRRLERLAPPFMKGSRRTTLRIRWAIEELERMRAVKNEAKRKAG